MRRLDKELGLAKRDVGLIRGKTFRIEPVTMAMQQTLWKLPDDAWREINRVFGVVVCDEVQRFAARTFLQCVDRFAARYRVGISADETRKDKKEFLTYDVFGGVAASVTQDRLVEAGLVHEVAVRVLPTDFRADWYVEHRERWRDKEDDEVEQPPDYKRLLDEIEVDDDRNQLAMDWALTEAGLARNVLVFSQRREHCRRLNVRAVEAGYGGGLLLGGDDPNDVAEFARVVARVDAGEQRVACGTVQAIGQGHDWPSIHRGVVATPVANKQSWGQVRGRICRTTDGKKDAAVYYLWDRHVFGDVPLRNLKRWNKDVSVNDGKRWVDVGDYLKGGK
jgi:superfamily II DNA or RNA helicase